jgi:hypothetical protein
VGNETNRPRASRAGSVRTRDGRGVRAALPATAANRPRASRAVRLRVRALVTVGGSAIVYSHLAECVPIFRVAILVSPSGRKPLAFRRSLQEARSAGEASGTCMSTVPLSVGRGGTEPVASIRMSAPPCRLQSAGALMNPPPSGGGGVSRSWTTGGFDGIAISGNITTDRDRIVIIRHGSDGTSKHGTRRNTQYRIWCIQVHHQPA